MLRSFRNGAGVVLVALLVAALLSGCASNKSYSNLPKPPPTLTVSVFVGEDDIALSPNPFGAGPTRFVITNQTGVKQNVLLSSDTIDRTVAVGSGQTTNFKQTVQPGDLELSASDTAANSVTVKVGAKRGSAQQDLNQP